MADPDTDYDITWDEDGYVDILQSTFFDVNPRVDFTIEDYFERTLIYLVEAIDEHFEGIEWRISTNHSRSSVDLLDLAEEACERDKDGYLRSEPALFVTSDPTSPKRSLFSDSFNPPLQASSIGSSKAQEAEAGKKKWRRKSNPRFIN
ncbi:hypothetical protein KFK09_007388 [Dendrobium nobile]|uniref:Uncharacterized protein n=1 Tax=Dendrobium nobile TaxID=94219 RepID=A0A8T3BV24_DENNO|nr:hypothetical protein KFK09_007388 [Dendrobium nobile]